MDMSLTESRSNLEGELAEGWPRGGTDATFGAMKNVMILCALIVLAGCGDDGDDTIDFATGDLVFSTLSVDDQCLDGGLNLLFMPEGTQTPWDWPIPVKVYEESALPSTYEIQLRDPFGKMTVTARDAGENVQQVQAERNEGVLLGASTFGSCVADMDAIVDIELESPDRASGVASLTLSNARGDDRCPSEMPTSCQVFLRFQAERR